MSIATFPAPHSFAGIALNQRGRAVARIVVLAVTAVALMAAAVTIVLLASHTQARAGEAASGAAVAESGTVDVVVGPGETLWDIAAQSAGEQDTREVMTQIVELNGLETSVLQPGQRLAVPDPGN